MSARWTTEQLNGAAPAKKKPVPVKAQSASEMMDLSQSPIAEIIDNLVCKVDGVVSYHQLHIEVTYKGEEYRVKVEKV